MCNSMTVIGVKENNFLWSQIRHLMLLEVILLFCSSHMMLNKCFLVLLSDLWKQQIITLTVWPGMRNWRNYIYISAFTRVFQTTVNLKAGYVERQSKVTCTKTSILHYMSTKNCKLSREIEEILREGAGFYPLTNRCYLSWPHTALGPNHDLTRLRCCDLVFMVGKTHQLNCAHWPTGQWIQRLFSVSDGGKRIAGRSPNFNDQFLILWDE